MIKLANLFGYAGAIIQICIRSVLLMWAFIFIQDFNMAYLFDLLTAYILPLVLNVLTIRLLKKSTVNFKYSFLLFILTFLPLLIPPFVSVFLHTHQGFNVFLTMVSDLFTNPQNILFCISSLLMLISNLIYFIMSFLSISKKLS
ncbi:hypothetical protein JHL18_07815 [Clostridium sp. YIM B02505]|uniref:Uncharacterized protein n=1 Tax=Clostridium yunnanense TaxID=2800325 RepID=A0ABS1EME6_9CLOT|nr:hypothetical protein [Clostridium yunnanense]MBK1810540.1 hypothetical protein [Clostridium yunnanense]